MNSLVERKGNGILKNRHLFLFGGSPPFTSTLGRVFANVSLNKEANIAILFLERDGWETYMKKYTNVLEENNIKEFVYLPLNTTSKHTVVKMLKKCTGIIIGGGETEVYRNYIVDTEIGDLIKKRYDEGTPVAGFSAGALISPANCVISPIDNSKREHLFLSGLGLIKNCIVSVHFTKWNEEKNIKAALKTLNIPLGYGIDDGVGLYFENEFLSEADGGDFYTFTE